MTLTGAHGNFLARYLDQCGGQPLDPVAAAVYASLDHLTTVFPSVARAIIQEFRDQRRNLKLIASENYCSLAVQFA